MQHKTVYPVAKSKNILINILVQVLLEINIDYFYEVLYVAERINIDRGKNRNVITFGSDEKFGARNEILSKKKMDKVVLCRHQS